MKALELHTTQIAKAHTRMWIQELCKQSKVQRMLEISPGNKPILPKNVFSGVLYADYFDTEGVKKNNHERYGYRGTNFLDIDISLAKDPELKALKQGGFDLCASSHVLEHIPNPITHIQTIERLLSPKGVYIMIVPDKNCNFDTFRHPTDTTDWVEAFLTKSQKAQRRQIFDFFLRHIADRKQGMHKQQKHTRANQKDYGSEFVYSTSDAARNTQNEVEKLRSADYYFDLHNWAFTPSSLRLMLIEINMLGYTSLYPTEVSNVIGDEFIVILRRSSISVAEKESARFQVAQEVFL